MTTYVFPGQGAQIRGMGELLFIEFPEVVMQANRILGYSINYLCSQNPNGQLDQTQFTQVAIYVVNALSYMKKIKENQKPDYVAGHSLGEYNALLAADVFDFKTGLKLVQKRSELMSQATGGGMAAILGLNSTEIEKILKQHRLVNVNIANYNSYAQTVISGLKDEVSATQNLFEQAGSTFIPLQVSGAFHSPYMETAKLQFASFLDSFHFNTPLIPVIANVNAKIYQPDTIKSWLLDQITSPVLWLQTIEYLLTKGETDFHEVGPGTILTKLITRIQKGG